MPPRLGSIGPRGRDSGAGAVATGSAPATPTGRAPGAETVLPHEPVGVIGLGLMGRPIAVNEPANLTLVDPDNRNDVDFAAHRDRLARLDAGGSVESLDDEVMLVTSRTLRLRRERPELFATDHRPLALPAGLLGQPPAAVRAPGGVDRRVEGDARRAVSSGHAPQCFAPGARSGERATAATRAPGSARAYAGAMAKWSWWNNGRTGI